MKNSILSYLITILIISSTGIYSQNESYIPIINPEHTWSILADYTAGGGNLQSFYLRIGDTIILKNGKEYHKIYQTYDSTGLEDNWNQIGFLSEDIETKQCRFMNMNSDEGLIYDFSANVGDTLNMWNTMHQNVPVDVVVLEKDSVLIGGFYRNRLNIMIIPYPGVTEYWIEGVGSTEGLLFSAYTLIGVNYFLLCFFENDELTYHLDEHETCYYGHNAGIDDFIEKKDDIQIWPNPAKEWTSFNYTLPGNETEGVIIITDVTGKIIETIIVSENHGQRIWNTENINPGVYYYTLKSNSLQRTGKLIII